MKLRDMYRRIKRQHSFSIKNLNLNLNWGKIVFWSTIAISLLVVVVFAWYSRDLPDPSKVQRKTGFSTEIMDRTGKVVLYDVYTDQDRKFTPLSEVSDYLKKATIAIEDKDFYEHGGFDPMAALRIAKNVVTRRRLIGGSTLTQQLVKMLLLTNERKLSRKIREFVLAVRIEKTFSKDEILQMYLNEAPYGGTAVGVASASKTYFGKEPSELTLSESILLAGLPQSPSRYSPYGSNDKAYLPRAKEVARRMREDGVITSEMEEVVNKELDDMKFVGQASNKIKAPHFVMFIKQQLEEMYGEAVLETGGLKVTTSLDWDLQQKAELAVKEEIDKVSNQLNITNGSSVALDVQTGEILSMVGSKDFFDKTIDGEVNVATRLRQPGSSIKPLVYAVALSKGFSPSSVIADVVTEFPGRDENTPYQPKNYDGKEHGLLHLREALASSINVPAVKLTALVGVDKILSQAYKMGLNSLEPTRETLSRVGLSMALGGGEVKLLELSSAYAAFANGGQKVVPVSILKIEDSSNRVIYEKKDVRSEKVLDDKVAFLISSMLSDNSARLLTFGPNSYLNMGANVAVKTGTTNDLRDNWTVGWNSNYIVGVWVGNNNNEKMKNVASGVSGAAPIWRRQMQDVMKLKSDKGFEKPSGVVQVEVDKISGYPAHDGFASYKEWFVEGTVPNGSDPIHTLIKLCKGDNSKIADAVSISQGNFDTREAIIIKEKDPLTNKDLWQKAIDFWVTGQVDQIYKIPTQECGASAAVDIQIVSPGDKSRIDGDTLAVKYTVASNKGLVETRIYIDDVLEATLGSETSVTRDIKVTTGKHNLRIVGKDADGREDSKTYSFAVNMDWNDSNATSSGQI